MNQGKYQVFEQLLKVSAPYSKRSFQNFEKALWSCGKVK